MKQHDQHEWAHRAFRSGSHSVDCLTNKGHTANVAIVHHGAEVDDTGDRQEGRVFVRLAYWRAGQLKVHFLEIPDSE